jgi:hypothetical protein
MQRSARVSQRPLLPSLPLSSGRFFEQGSETGTMNDVSNFLTKEGWEAGQEFGISIRYKGDHEAVSVTEFLSGDNRLFVAALTDDTEVLLVPFSLCPKGSCMNWLPVDVENLDLATVIAAGIEKCER